MTQFILSQKLLSFDLRCGRLKHFRKLCSPRDFTNAIRQLFHDIALFVYHLKFDVSQVTVYVKALVLLFARSV